jgi:ABC-type multidrug transport system ATPase subunit
MNLTISNLSKTYANGVRALHNVSLDIPSGMFGLLGPNGAGKSTLMRTIATLQQPDSGGVRLGDIDVLSQPDEVRKILGYLPQDFGFYPSLSAERVLDHFAELKGVANSRERRELVHALLRQTNLWDNRARGTPAPPHRRRANRGARPQRAASLSESPLGDRRRRHRHSLDAHRRRRARAVSPHGDHQRR